MNINDIKRVLILGAGTIGEQVGLQFARFGFQVHFYDPNPDAITTSPTRLQTLLQTQSEHHLIQESDFATILDRITWTADPHKAADDVDLVSESVPENLTLKRDVFEQFGKLCKPEAIFTTNSSYLLPSSLARATGRPDRFAAFHFHVPVWIANAVDIMPHKGTSTEVTDLLFQLAWRVNQVPIRSQRENPGYVFNAILPLSSPNRVFSLGIRSRRMTNQSRKPPPNDLSLKCYEIRSETTNLNRRFSMGAQSF